MGYTFHNADSSCGKYPTKTGGKVRVFRKSRTSRLGKACWWFHLKRDESDLCELEKEWNTVALQTEWKLEYYYKPNTTVLL